MISRLSAGRILICAAGSMALVGCMTANPRTLYELSRFDPLSADPADIAVAVKTDRKLHLRQGDVVLRMALDSDDKSRAFDERFVLSITRDTGTANLAGSLKETEHVLSAAVAAGDRERFRAVQARARKAREEKATGGKGSMTVAISGGCKTGPLEGEDVHVRSYMRTETGGTYFPLTGEMKLADVFKKAGVPVADISYCDGEGTG